MKKYAIGMLLSMMLVSGICANEDTTKGEKIGEFLSKTAEYVPFHNKGFPQTYKNLLWQSLGFKVFLAYQTYKGIKWMFFSKKEKQEESNSTITV